MTDVIAGTGGRATARSSDLAAILFPGQGAQAPGMGLELARAFPATAGAVFRTADRILGFRLSRIIGSGSSHLLSRTEITQPALLAAGLAAWEALRSELPGFRPAFAAGLSLGEYAALAAAGAIEPADAFRLVSWRGRYMDDAARLNRGTMCAVLGLERTVVEGLCRCAGDQQAAGGGDEGAARGDAEGPAPGGGKGSARGDAEGAARGNGREAVDSGRGATPGPDSNRVWVANYNAPGQNVIAGEEEAVGRASGRAAAAGGKVVPLKVSGAFHCPLMGDAKEQLSPLLSTAPWHTPAFPVYSNVTAAPYESAAAIATGLEAQITSPVRWEDIIRDMWDRGVRYFIELGPGRTVSSLVSRTVRDAITLNVADLGSLTKTVAALAEAGLAPTGRGAARSTSAGAATRSAVAGTGASAAAEEVAS